MAKQPKKEAVKPDVSKDAPAKSGKTVVKAAGKVAEVVKPAAEAVQGHVGQPVVDAVEKPKKPRFVRLKTEKRPQPKAAPLPPRSTRATAKLMTKGLAVPPKDEKPTGQKPKA